MMRRFILLATLACALATADKEGGSNTLSKSLSIDEDLGGRVPFDEAKPSHILRFVLSSRALHKELQKTKLAVVAALPPRGQGETEQFINKTAAAAKILEQQYRYGKNKFILTDSEAHIGNMVAGEDFRRIMNVHLAKPLAKDDLASDELRNDHHSFQMELNDEVEEKNRRLESQGQLPIFSAQPFMDRVQGSGFPAFIIAANGEPKEVWSARDMSEGDLAARVAAIASGKLRVLTAQQVASYALRNPVDATVIVRHTSKTSQALRIALAPFAQVIGGNEDFFAKKVPSGSFLVLTRNSTLSGVPLPHATRARSLNDFFSEEASNRMLAEGMLLVEVNAEEAGKGSYTHTKALRRHTLSLSKSKSKSKSLSVEGGGNGLSEAALIPPIINADASLGMESLKVISRLVVPAIGEFKHTTMQAVYARAPCIVFTFHGDGLYSLPAANITSDLKRECTFLYGNGGQQKMIASFGFDLSEAGDEGTLLVGVHYDHGKYAMREIMEEIPMVSGGAHDKEVMADEPEKHDDEEGDDEEDDVYESRLRRSDASGVIDEEPMDAYHPHDGAHMDGPLPPRFRIGRVAQKVGLFVRSVLEGKTSLYEKTQQFEGELTDPAATMVGEFFTDFMDTDDIHSRMLSDYTRDSFIVVFPPKCADGCDDELRLMSTVVGGLDSQRNSIANTMSLGFYNLTLNSLHKHMDPVLASAEGATLVFIERMKKFNFFMHNHARYSHARFRGGLQYDDHSEDGVIETETLDLKGATSGDVFAFIKKHCRGSEDILKGDGQNLEELEYDEL